MQLNNKKICIIIFFFGKLPWYFNFFKQSCIHNANVDFLFFNDSLESKEKYAGSNFKTISFSITDFNSLASKKLNFDVNVKNGYKICEFRPAFGLIFEDYLRNYDFWGYSDVDLILGRIGSFFTEDVLELYDFISVKPEYPSGYFALYKNTKIMNHLFKDSRDYKWIFGVNKNLLFEECGGYYKEVMSGINILDTNCNFESFFHVLEKNRNKINMLFDFYSIEGTPGNIKFESGILSYRNEYEVLLYHLSDYKINIFSLKKRWKKIPDKYIINSYTFSDVSFFSKYLNSILNFLIPILATIIFNIDSFLSKKFNLKSIIEVGTYSYMNENIEVSKKEDHYFLMKKDRIFLIKKSLLFQNFFYLKDGNEKFKMINEKGKEQKIIKVFGNGNLITYTINLG